MNKEQFAALLDGREYGKEITKDEVAIAKENGLVVVFGASDDLMEFRGAWHDEFDCWEGGTAYVNPDGVFESECDNECCAYALRELEKCKRIEAVWCGDDEISWTYETDIPHVTFKIFEDDECYCVGIVFSVEDVK